jgi:hypothetical protein
MDRFDYSKMNAEMDSNDEISLTFLYCDDMSRVGGSWRGKMLCEFQMAESKASSIRCWRTHVDGLYVFPGGKIQSAPDI